jgi:oligopeptide/dipeptide ABC transporter ATP-binding protein
MLSSKDASVLSSLWLVVVCVLFRSVTADLTSDKAALTSATAVLVLSIPEATVLRASAKPACTPSIFFEISSLTPPTSPPTSLSINSSCGITFSGVVLMAAKAASAPIPITVSLCMPATSLLVASFVSSIVNSPGKIIESGATKDVLKEPLHPYTQALVSAIPDPNPENRLKYRDVPAGEPPSPMAPPSGCRFHPRCPHFIAGKCDVLEPQLTKSKNNYVACHLYS